MPKNDTAAINATVSGRATWVSPHISRLTASEAELGPAVGGPDLERVS
jgi:hypothetical protein